MTAHRVLVTALAACVAVCARADAADDAALIRQRVQYDADVPKTVLDLQPFRTQTQVSIRRQDGASGTAALININPAVGAWYTLNFSFADRETVSYHLQAATPLPALRVVSIAGGGAAIQWGEKPLCEIWSGDPSPSLKEAVRDGMPYAPLCLGAIYLRNRVAGRGTSLERITDFLRDHVWGGERMVELVKENLYRDAFRDPGVSGPVESPMQAGGGPGAARTSDSRRRSVTPQQLGLELVTPQRELTPGQWYGIRGIANVWFSAVAPQDIDDQLLHGNERGVNALDREESGALVYLVAFDLRAFDLHFSLGTDHPRVDWSDRPPAEVRTAQLPGPDGIDSTAPLVMNGLVSPALVSDTVATFAGGFKRSHGAFRDGALARSNHGSHYGFMEEGAILSKLQPGLATVVVTTDGAVDLRTWREKDVERLSAVRYARQNGLPLIERNAEGEGVPGSFVNLWGPGNWSGSASEDLRTLRAGLCLQEGFSGNFLIYAYFSAATPSAMARVFQAYNCRYAMHLDMNALEHTYLALYLRQGNAPAVEHLISGMEVVDRTVRGHLAPRFLAYPDDRDFFYLTRKTSW